MIRKRALALAIIGVVALSLTGCGDVELRSHYRDGEVTVDGNYDDWDGKLTFIEKANLSVGVQNDETDLYVILIVGDRETQRRIMMSGMFLWFDSGGEKEKQFGIHYPLGFKNLGEMMRPGKGGGDPDKMREKFAEESLEEAELIGAGGAVRITRGVGNLPGIELKTTNDRGAMVYEYRIPLVSDVDSPYGIGGVAGTTIGVGLITPDIDMSEIREKMRESKRGRGGGKGSGGMGGRGGGGRGGMGGGSRSPSGGMDMPDPIDIWATLQLAGKP